MNKILGIFGLLIFVCVFTGVLSPSFEEDPQNLYNVIRRSAPYGIIGIGAAFVIITGGIDLSIGSMVCLIGCLMATAIMDHGWSPYLAISAVMLLSLVLGLFHGVLVTKLKLQPFVVTLFGFLAYRGFARWFCEDQPMGFRDLHDDGLRQLAIGQPWKGYEQNLAALAGLAGLVFLIFSIGKLVWQRRNNLSGQTASWVGAGFSLLVAIAGFSQLLGGADTMVVKLAGGLELALNPETLFRLFGMILFVPLSLVFIGSGLSANTRTTWRPTLALVLSTVFFVYVAYAVAPTFRELSPGGEDPRAFGLLTLSEGSVRNLIMIIVFLATACWMGSIGWVANQVPRVSELGKTLLMPTIIAGVLWLLGMTKLPETRLPMPLLILLGCGIIASIFLNQTIYGRYLLALGRKEEAARYSGINTDLMTILAYVICGLMSGLGAILFALDINSMQPANHGNVYELYAIAAAVLGGCSLRGGEGTIVGVIIGAAVVRVIYNSINILQIDTKLEYVVIGVVILAGVIADEIVKRNMAAKRAGLRVAD